MNQFVRFAVWFGLIVCALSEPGKGAPASDSKADTSGVNIEPDSGEIQIGAKITITFPTAMVGADQIDMGGQPSPFTSEPALIGDFLWKSQTEGVFTVRGIVAGTQYQLMLASGLKDAAGKPINIREWRATFETPGFSFSSDYQEREHLSSRPQVPLEATYDVRYPEAAEHIYFQDRDSRMRFPSEVIQTEEGPLEGHSFMVDPREPLPVGRTYDLIIDGLLDSASRRPLPHLAVFPAGTTVPLEVEWVGAFNDPLSEPAIRLKFNDDIDPKEATQSNIVIEPAVDDVSFLASGDQVEVKGDFDRSVHYRVTISKSLKGERGYGLEAESRWGATFHAKPASIIFPSSNLFVRARKEVRFPFLQVNTPTATWKLARIPLEKLSSVAKRVREFDRSKIDPLTGKPIVDPRTGFDEPYPTELLVDAFSLQVAASGQFDAATDDEEMRREAHCLSENGGALSGAYLFEATAAIGNGRIVGNRSIVNVSDFVLTQKRTQTKVLIRVSRMSDLEPGTGVLVRAVTDENIELARSVTDQNGIAEFAQEIVLPAKGVVTQLFIADTPEGPSLHFAEENVYPSGSDHSWTEAKRHVEIISDRNLYAPGQVIKIKGIARDRSGGGLAIPNVRDVHWKITEGENGRVAGEGKSILSDYGAWESEWTIPDKTKLGDYEIRCEIGGQDYAAMASIKIEEFRVPLFSTLVETSPEVGDTAHARVSSVYFHGAPNVGAHVHWKATWTVSNAASGDPSEIRRYNEYREVGPVLNPDDEITKIVEGDATLDEHGFVTLGSASPYKGNLAIARAVVSWRAEVTSADGQTITGGDTGVICFQPERLGVLMTEQSGTEHGVKVSIDAVDEKDQKRDGIAVRAELFHVVTKTVKEQVAPFVFRYRNSDQFTSVASRDTKTPADIDFPAKDTGRYVVAVHATASNSPFVSNETTVSGDQPAELPVENETAFQIEHRTEPYLPGETAELTTQAAFAGTAWVSVETDEILDTFLVPLKGNAGRIDIPIKKEYAPNATVAIYLTRPGGENELPRERFAYSEIQVRRPDRELNVQAHLVSDDVKPGDMVRGDVQVMSEAKSVADADVVIFAVDEAVLKLGDWHLPDLLAGFYPNNRYMVRSYQSLERYEQDVAKTSLYQKGFIIGGGGDEGPSHNVPNIRKDFRVLAFWQGSALTDPQGKTSFEFKAPDNLTTYRIVAIAQTKDNRFGGNANQTVKISKPLLIETALPRFLRDGDDVELRAVARQKFVDSAEIAANCEPSAGCQLVGERTARETGARDASVVFRFKARIVDPELTPIKIRFSADAKPESDAVEITLPVLPASITRKESVVGQFAGPGFDAQAHMPETWKKGLGTFGVTLSTSPWLPKIAGLPIILDYPHGCFEQISSRLLSYSLLANLLAYLPDATARDAEYRATIERGMQQFADSLLPGGMLPYWPGTTTGNAFVTCQALWAVNEAINAGFNAPEGLKDKLAQAAEEIANGLFQSTDFNRSFALFVLAQTGTDHDLRSVADDLYLQRNQSGDEGRALLAIALNRLNIMPKEVVQLLREIDVPIVERAFSQNTFTSVARAEAISAYAFDAISAKFWTQEKMQPVRKRMLALMDSATSLSTQENLWLLLEFKAMIGTEKFDRLSIDEPKGTNSPNGSSIAWMDRKISDGLIVAGLNGSPMTFLMHGEYNTNEIQTDRVDHGFRLERVVRNLTDLKRDGTSGAPFKLGDKILITFRVNTQKLQNYVALEDPLPAGLEIVNPDLAMIGKFFEIPSDSSDRQLELSYSEMKDKATRLYFDRIDPGTGTYSILARAVVAGSFRWPATQIAPMYESRFFGFCPSSLCVISGE
jgi:uncharacterized protein YfaS (alpha-2-macroglobulin family)